MGIILSAKNSIKRILCSTLSLLSSFWVFFFVPGPLGGLKLSQGTFLDTLTRLEAFKRIFVFRPKIDFFPRGKSSP